MSAGRRDSAWGDDKHQIENGIIQENRRGRSILIAYPAAILTPVSG
jgi:hypothetical protein